MIENQATFYQLPPKQIPKPIRKLLAKHLTNHPVGLELGALIQEALEFGKMRDPMTDVLEIPVKLSTKKGKIKTRFWLSAIRYSVPYNRVKMQGMLGELVFEVRFNLSDKSAEQLQKILEASSAENWCFTRKEPIDWMEADW